MTVRKVWLAVASLTAVVLLVAAGGIRWSAGGDTSGARIPSTADLAAALEELRQEARIPGLALVIAEDDRVVWSRTHGWADLEERKPVREDTIFPLASLTKPYTATVVLQLVSEGRLDLHAPVREFGVDLPADVRVWHLLSHTSEEPPGTSFRYDGAAFGHLTAVVERAAGRPFGRVLSERIIQPLDLSETAPNPATLEGIAADDPSRIAFAASGVDRDAVEPRLATGYARAWGRFVHPAGLFGPLRPMEHGTLLFAAAGLMASARDVAAFSMALDRGRLLGPDMLARAFTPVRTPSGEMLPYGLGWFVQETSHGRLVWHYGHFYESSSLLVKLPERGITFVALANSDGLSRGRGLGRGDVMESAAAALFLNWLAHRNAR